MQRTGEAASFVISSNHTITECVWCHIKTVLLVIWLPGQSLKPFLEGYTVPVLWVRKLKKTEVNYLQAQNVLSLQWWQGYRHKIVKSRKYIHQNRPQGDLCKSQRFAWTVKACIFLACVRRRADAVSSMAQVGRM